MITAAKLLRLMWGMLVVERMTGPVEHGERGAWVLLEQVPGTGIADRGVLASSHKKRRAPV